MNETHSPCLWGIHRIINIPLHWPFTCSCSQLFSTQCLITLTKALLEHITHLLRVTAECLCWYSRSSMIWLPSTFLSLSLALLLNGSCALANLGYLQLPMWAWIYCVLDSFQPLLHFYWSVLCTFLQLSMSCLPNCCVWLYWLHPA